MAVKKLVIYTDGASRGNPGPAAIGVVIQDENGRAVDTISQCLGETTNNQAEYRAIIAGLEKALSHGATHVELRSDSELVVRQLCGQYQVKNVDLKPLFQKVQALRSRFVGLSFNYIPREKNRKADELANDALDGKTRAPKAAEAAGASGIAIRRAVKADYPAIIAIIVELEDQHIAALPEVFRKESYAEQARDLDAVMAEKNAALLVAEKGGEILGYIHMALQAEENHPALLPRQYVKVRDLAVARKYQRSGAGRVLMQSAEDWARERGVKTVDLNVWEFNRGAFAFYQKLGYTTSSRHMWKHV